MLFYEIWDVWGIVSLLVFHPSSNGSLGCSLGLCRHHWGWATVVFCVVWLGSRYFCLKNMPCYSVPFLVLWLEKAGFGWVSLEFFFPAFLGPCRLLVLSASTVGCTKQKKTQGNHSHVTPQILRFLIGLPSSLNLSESVGLQMVLPVMSRDFSCPLQEE